MAFDIKHMQKENYLYIKIHDPASVKEFEQVLKNIINSIEYPPDINTIWDISSTDLSDIDINFERALVSVRENFPIRGKAKIAILADSDLSFGVSRVYEMLSDRLPQKISVFRDKHKAIDWIKSKTAIVGEMEPGAAKADERDEKHSSNGK